MIFYAPLISCYEKISGCYQGGQRTAGQKQHPSKWSASIINLSQIASLQGTDQEVIYVRGGLSGWICSPFLNTGAICASSH